jgi:hypothetical protein
LAGCRSRRYRPATNAALLAYVSPEDFLGIGSLETSVGGRRVIAVGDGDSLDEALMGADAHNAKPSLAVWDNKIGEWVHPPKQ